eukprot:10699532-Alexandrium_andersonii.AAC.1
MALLANRPQRDARRRLLCYLPELRLLKALRRGARGFKGAAESRSHDGRVRVRGAEQGRDRREGGHHVAQPVP